MILDSGNIPTAGCSVRPVLFKLVRASRRRTGHRKGRCRPRRVPGISSPAREFRFRLRRSVIRVPANTTARAIATRMSTPAKLTAPISTSVTEICSVADSVSSTKSGVMGSWSTTQCYTNSPSGRQSHWRPRLLRPLVEKATLCHCRHLKSPVKWGGVQPARTPEVVNR